MSNILIVDDSEDLLDVMKFFLEERGYTVKTLSGAQNLVPEIRSFSPDLIILDIILEGDNGRDICKELRRHVETKYLCVLIFSASSRALDDYKECGADGYIEKPFGLNEIIKKIEATLATCKDYQPQNN